jgi:DNA-binding transcriptional ArsR family regulator
VLELLTPGEQSVASLLAAVGVEQPHLSQQLGVLRRAGLVVTRREGSSVVYALADERIAELLAVSKQILLDMLTTARDELSVS